MSRAAAAGAGLAWRVGRSPGWSAARSSTCPNCGRKVSGCLRTFTGARQFCAIRSYLSTAAKHGLCAFDALVMLTTGQPWMPATG